MATPDLQRLGARVKKRRLALNLSIKRAAVMADLSKDTWTRVEEALPVRHLTYDKIESALSWTVGSCRKIMDGGDAIVLGEDAGDVEYASVPPADLEDRSRRAVQSAMVAGTNLTADRIRAITDLAVEALRKEGVIPPEG